MRRRQLYALEAGGCAPPVIVESPKVIPDAVRVRKVCPRCGKTGRGIHIHIQHCKK